MGDDLDCESYHHCQQPHRPLDPNGPDFNITVEYLGSNVTVDWQYNGTQINCAEHICGRIDDTSDGLYYKMVQCLIFMSVKIKIYESCKLSKHHY